MITKTKSLGGLDTSGTLNVKRSRNLTKMVIFKNVVQLHKAPKVSSPADKMNKKCQILSKLKTHANPIKKKPSHLIEVMKYQNVIGVLSDNLPPTLADKMLPSQRNKKFKNTFQGNHSV